MEAVHQQHMYIYIFMYVQREEEKREKETFRDRGRDRESQGESESEIRERERVRVSLKGGSTPVEASVDTNTLTKLYDRSLKLPEDVKLSLNKFFLEHPKP